MEILPDTDRKGLIAWLTFHNFFPILMVLLVGTALLTTHKAIENIERRTSETEARLDAYEKNTKAVIIVTPTDTPTPTPTETPTRKVTPTTKP